MELQVKIDDGLYLNVSGIYNKAEPEVGIGQYFEVDDVQIVEGDTYDVFEWVASKGSGWLEEINQLCIDKIHE